MQAVTKDHLGLGLPSSIPGGTTIKLKLPKHDLFVLPSPAFLNESEGEYSYLPARGTDFIIPAEYIDWGPEVMKPHGSDFHRAASEELTKAIQDSSYEAIRNATYKLKFVQKAP